MCRFSEYVPATFYFECGNPVFMCLKRKHGRERAMRFFRNSRKAMKKWRMRALFVDLHKTRVTISEPVREHVPPWVFKKLAACEKKRQGF